MATRAVLLTQRQMSRLDRLPDDHRVVSAQGDEPVVRRPDGQLLRVQRNGRVSPATLVDRVQTYLDVGE